MTVGIRSIAKHLGVSVSTVSSVVNDRGYVSPQMRKRVEEYLRKIDYQPNYVARSLRRQETRIIGLIVPDLVNFFYTELSRAAEDFLLASGYQLIVADSREDWKRQQDYLTTFCRMMTDGILLVPSPATDAQITSIPAMVRGRPLVYLDRSPVGSPVDAVLIDNHKAAYAATRHLIEKGHRRIAIITEPLNLLCAADRLEGYRQVLEDHQIVVDPELIHIGGNTKESAYEIGLRLLARRDRPTAAVVCNNQMTLGFLKALRECNVACPDEFSVVGFDECDWSEHMQPPLTTIRQPAAEMGATAARVLLARLSDRRETPPTTTILGFHLVERSSTAVYAPKGRPKDLIRSDKAAG
jgi:LacI family transcriptional regulator